MIHTFPSGLRFIHKQTPQHSQLAYAGFAINVGARDDDSQQKGMSHFIEHMLFKGTNKRKAFHIIQRMDAIGADIDAYTSKEETIIYTTCLVQHLPRAIELLSSIVTSSIFPQKEIDKEILVIQDEMMSYLDSPSESIGDEADIIAFGKHPLANPILGLEEHLKIFDTQMSLDFFNQHYSPGNMVFFSMSPVKEERIIKLLEKSFEGINHPLQNNRVNRIRPEESHLLPSTYGQTIVKNKELMQTNILMGARAFSMKDKRKTALILLNNLLGGHAMNSRLNIALREKRGLAYSVEANFAAYTDSGLASIYLGTHAKSTNKAVAIVRQELDKLCQNPLNPRQLAAIKKQTLGQIAISQQYPSDSFLSMGKKVLHFANIESSEIVAEKINNVTSQEIQDIAQLVYAPENIFTLIFE